MSIQPWQRIEPTEEEKVGYRYIIHKTFRLPTGVEGSFTTIGRQTERAAGVIALTPDNRVIVARQYRPGPEKFMDEIPGGSVDAGEDVEVAAIRELAEETGYKPGTVSYLGVSSRDAYMNGKWHYFLARDCDLTNQGQKLEPTEDVEVLLMTIPEFLQAAKEDRLTDPVAVLYAYDELIKIQESTHA